MKISTILDHVDSGHIALPEFQRGDVWNRDQVRGLFDSLYRRHPVGGLLVWATEFKTPTHRGDGPLTVGVVKLLLDGQQRITTLYRVVRGKPPKFFDGNVQTFTGLRFHLDAETFAFYQPLKMQDDPLWNDLTELMRKGTAGLGEFIARLSQDPALAPKVGDYAGRLSRLVGIMDIDLHVEEVTGADKSLDVVADIFNRVNSGGTKLSKGDLALAKICADWSEARDTMKQALKGWADSGYHFNLDWLLRSVNTVLTGEAKFSFLHEKSAEEVQDGLKRATRRIDACLNLIGSRLGLDHDEVLFGRFGVPVMVHYLEQRHGALDAGTRDKLLFWFVQAGMWGRFSGSTVSYIDQDVAALEGDGDVLEKLLEQLRLWHGGLQAKPGHFAGWSLGARFYPVLYLLTRMGEAKDWGTGLPLKSSLLGKMNRLEVHHIFPKAQLYKLKYTRPEVNALANFCFQTKETNLEISDRLPEEYFPVFEQRHAGGLASQWIPSDPELWKMENYRDFLEARRELLAAETNKRMEELLHGDTRWLEGPAKVMHAPVPVAVGGGITSETEEEELVALNNWVEAQGLPRGQMSFEYADPNTGEQRGIPLFHLGFRVQRLCDERNPLAGGGVNMTDQPDTLDLRSHDPAEDKRQELLRLFPEICTEGGKLDFERLRLALGEAVDVGRERYGMNWPGKADCFKTIQAPSLVTLRPCREESVDFDSTENLIIEGDNLEVLKLLQKSYLGKVKMIYIDPPYNTGNDFIYPDDYTESLQTYLEYTGQVDAEGRKFGTNTDAEGRFHSKWLNMMYPRLYLARNLLREDGAIFINIDDHEIDNLKKVCNEVFGEENFVCSFVWEKRYSPPPDTKEVGYAHENILFHRKSDKYVMRLLPLTGDQKARYKNPDNDKRGYWKPMDYTCRYTADERPSLYYQIINPNTGEEVWPKRTRVWAFSREVHQRNEQERRIWWGVDGKAKVPALKNFLSEIQQGMMSMTLLKHDAVGNTDEATKELRDIIPDLKYTPKPTRLLKHLSLIANLTADDVVLDYFAGSGTTAHAVLDPNKQDGGNRRFILVQLPEPTGRRDYPTIVEIPKKHVRRVIKKLNEEDAGKLDLDGAKKQDRGFRVFKLAESNFKPWNAEAPKDAEELDRQLELHVDHIREGRTADDLLYEILLKSGFPLTTPVETPTLAGKTVHSVAGEALFICLERELTLELIRAMAECKPERVVCLDEGFAGNDQRKANAVQIFKTKGVMSFKTV